MRLIFTHNGTTTLIPIKHSVACLTQIGADSKMVLESMKAGIPVVAHDGEYNLIHEDDLKVYGFKRDDE